MASAAVIAARVATLTVFVVMVVAVNIGVIAEIPGKQRVYRCISISADTAVKFYSHLCQCRLRTAANSATDENIYAVLHQETGQCAVTAAVGIPQTRIPCWTAHQT